jgi:23S rRNA (cytidine2498-2'-O)-methyltransferase
VIQEQFCILTAHPEFIEAGIGEMRRFDKRLTIVELLAPGIVLCAAPDVTALMRLAAEQHPIFIRHIAPVQTTVALTNTEQDISELAVAMAALPTFAQLERGQPFAVQTRLIQGDGNTVKRPYSSGQLNQMLAEAISEETGAVEFIKKPRLVVSLLCTTTKGYLGISSAQENLSDWPGGARHYAQLDEQISRAEFKLLEALEEFGVTLPTQGRPLDLGAAPGGWTRLLLEAGLHVVAVDPANLDPRLKGHPRLEHYRGYAETYLEEASKARKRFDIIANDMRMDARDAARLLGQASRCLTNEGFIVSVFKLPHATHDIDPLATLRAALNILDKYYAIIQARQLFHNRQEVTVITARPLSTSTRVHGT